MGTVDSSYGKCPNCKHNGLYESVYYHTGELYELCLVCGYNHSEYIKRDDNGDIVVGSDGVTAEYELKTIPGCGIYHVTYSVDGNINGHGVFSLENYPDDAEVEALMYNITEVGGYDLQFLSRFKDGQLEVLVGDLEEHAPSDETIAGWTVEAEKELA